MRYTAQRVFPPGPRPVLFEGADALLTDEERRRLDAADRSAADARWPDAFREFQLLLDSVRSRQDRAEERGLLSRFADFLDRSGDPVRARVTREYLARGFRDPTGHGRVRDAKTRAASRDRSEEA